MVTWLKLPLRHRSTIRFHPLLGLGASAMPTPTGSTSIITGIPGNAPRRLPLLAVLPSMVTTVCLSSEPVHTNTPEDACWVGFSGLYGIGCCDGSEFMLCCIACCGDAWEVLGGVPGAFLVVPVVAG